MGLTERTENALPRVELATEAINLFGQLIEALGKNEGLKKVLVDKFLKSPQVPPTPDGSSRILFISKGDEYQLNIQRSVEFEEISLSKVIDKVENRLTIWVGYDGITEGSCSLFGNTKRGKVNKAHLSFLEFDWGDSDKSIMYINNKEASEKTLKLIQQI